MGLKNPDEFMARLEAGFSLAAAIHGRNAPDRKKHRGLGTREGFEAHCREFPKWGQKAAALVEKNAISAQKRVSQILTRTHCKRGHLLEGENVGHRTGFTTRRPERYCRICHRWRETHAPPEMTPQQERRVIEAVRAGFNLNNIVRGTPDLPRICSFNTLKARRIAKPELDRFIIENIANANSRSKLVHFKLVPANARLVLAAPAIIKPVRKEIPPFLFRAGDLEWVASFVPRWISPSTREEIVQNTFMELCARAIGREDVPWAVKNFVADQEKQFPTKYRKFGDSLLVSLDEQLFEDGTAARGDSVSRGLWDD
ncbi:hypothetical protein [Bradyrhizobium sp. CIR3A]|uniref:hypothetical protein n=1 Tax=Bradyrhizobium sp. CIR3A TaxID=2663838 RepID=UPI0016060092|nr:hypothetical protein [Bradyrhizobium sp. CIR3A]MBB4258064.1 hypothetical protein [Bradyrhizobium sp. CIR3A]